MAVRRLTSGPAAPRTAGAPAAGFAHHFIKPVGVDTLLDLLKSLG